MATKSKLAVVRPEDEDEGGSFIAPATSRLSRADRRREARETAKLAAKARGQGPLSIEELLGATAPVDVLGNGRFIVNFYIHRFTSKLMRPVEDVESALARANVMQNYVKGLSARIEKEDRGLTEDEKQALAEFASEPITITASDLTEAYITALIGPKTEDGGSNRDQGLIESWTLTLRGETAPLTWEFMDGVLGADLVMMILRKIRERWTPGETKGVASA